MPSLCPAGLGGCHKAGGGTVSLQDAGQWAEGSREGFLKVRPGVPHMCCCILEVAELWLVVYLLSNHSLLQHFCGLCVSCN